MKRVLGIFGRAAGGLCLCCDAPAQGPGKSGYTLFNPTPRDQMREMSTDRPDITESPHTVDAGHFQLEMSFADFSYDRNSPDSLTTRGVAAAPMLLKAGLLNSVDLQLGLDPYTWIRTTDRAAGASETAQGFGDIALRLKVNLWGNDEGETAFALMPFVTFPTASNDLGAGEVEGGIIAPFGADLPHGFNLGLMAEFDFVRDEDGDGQDVEFVHTATIGRPIVGDLDGFIEYAGFASLSGGHSYRASFDAGLTYGATPDVQLDAGIRIGLTQASEDFGVFGGISVRY
ncbi:MAG: transporter [Planctomycetes bacterium]|nr:transporter [Planctomycetota bacterium]